MSTSSIEQGPIRQLARYQVGYDGLARCLSAIREYVDWVHANEPGTLLYEVWQERDNPTSFVHVCVFRDTVADRAHSQSPALHKFTRILGPECLAPVEFIDYERVAAKAPGQ